jgi:hypothetical protein
MHKCMGLPLAALILVIAIAPVLARADWVVDVHQDSMTDEIISSAICVNPEGFTLQVYRVKSGAVWATFRLPDTNSDVFSKKMPIMRVDKLAPDDLGDAATIMPELIQQEPKWVSWRIFHGEGAPDRGSLRDLMDGTKVVFRYYLFTGGFKETSFLLANAKTMIASALGVPVVADSNAAAKQAAFIKASEEATSRCMAMSGADATKGCMDEYLKCLEIANGDADKLRECLR